MIPFPTINKALLGWTSSFLFVALPLLAFSQTIVSDRLDEALEKAPLFVSNAFTPNGDGLNDRFFSNAKPSEHYEMLVYSREADLVFRSKDSNVGWNGSANTKQLRNGTYVWIIRYTNAQEEAVEKTGVVHLIR